MYAIVQGINTALRHECFYYSSRVMSLQENKLLTIRMTATTGVELDGTDWVYMEWNTLLFNFASRLSFVLESLDLAFCYV